MISAGNILMGNKKNFPASSNSNDFDRKIQDVMFKGIDLNMWGIMYGKYHEKEAKQFLETMKEACESLHIKMASPKMIQI